MHIYLYVHIKVHARPTWRNDDGLTTRCSVQQQASSTRDYHKLRLVHELIACQWLALIPLCV